jgi:hypothetical protein
MKEHHRMIRNAHSALTVVVAVSLFAGCSSFGEKVHETGNFITGASDSVVDRSPEQVVAAARMAIDDLHLIYINTETPSADRPQTVITARNHSDEKLTVTVTPDASKSKVVIVTGPLSNSMLRNKAIDDINYRLGLGGPPVIPFAATQPETQPTTSQTP